jgi:exonuclease III
MLAQQNLTRILFWNVQKKNLTDHICAISDLTKADVVILVENGSPADTVLAGLKTRIDENFHIPKSGDSSEKKFHCFCRDTKFDMSEIHSGTRTSTRNLVIGSKKSLLTLVHGVDIRNYDAESRQAIAQRVSREIIFVKKHQENNRSVILGDFNLNPFDRSMNLADGFNAMMTRRCVMQKKRKHLGEYFDFYYNPMWSLFGDNTDGPPGTFYDTSSQGPYGWSMPDQAILSHSIVDHFHRVKIITSSGKESLMDEFGRPDKRVASDHFPILLELTN